jgi:hypothetical protein
MFVKEEETKIHLFLENEAKMDFYLCLIDNF